MTKQIIDDRTIEACRRGDRDAFRLLYEAHKDRVYSIALCFFDGDSATAKDVSQDVFVKLMNGISQFDNRSQFTTWLYRVVANTCLDRKRLLRRFVPFPDWSEKRLHASASSQEEKHIHREMETAVRKVIGGMKPRLRMTILLKYFEDLSYDEIAVAMKCSRGTVASRLNRAHLILAQRLSRYRSVVLGGSDV